MKKAYLDYNATTPVDPRVLEAMMPYFKDGFGNPSSIHAFGSAARAALDEARERVAALLGAGAREILFTSGGSEGNNLAIKGAAFAEGGRGGKHMVTTRVEHDSTLEAFVFLESRGFTVTYLGVDGNGLVDLDELRESVTAETRLVSVIYANNETGAVMPVERIAGIVKEKGALLHVDAVQAAGKIEIDLKRIEADLVSISSHKFYGPKGAGALYVRDGLARRLTLAPLIHGGGQERGLRSGTENVPAVAGLGKAAELALGELAPDRERVGRLRDELLARISSGAGGVTLNGQPDGMVRNTLNLSFEGVNGGSLAMALDLEGIAVSTGSACSEGNVDPSHVLLAMGLTRKEAHSSVRFSLGRFTTREEIEHAAAAVVSAVKRIRGLKGAGS
ncbi:MAG: cysteine desulfurase [Candidatus Dadabacteria bacterium]|nr:cysteine desulfurase [Candidatus Dadabacteria bacterium]